MNVVAPGAIDTPLLANTHDVAEAVFYLPEAAHVTGEVLHVDDGAHPGKW